MRNGKITSVSLGQIKQNPNWKETYALGQLGELKYSIKMHGQLEPGIIDTHGYLISGHRRLECLKQLGIDNMDVIEKEVLSEETKFLMVHSNQQRIKTYNELVNEANILLEEWGNCRGKRRDIILKECPENAIEQMLKGRDKYDVIAEAIGFPGSGATLRRLMNVHDFSQKNPSDTVSTQIKEKVFNEEISIAKGDKLIHNYKRAKEETQNKLSPNLLRRIVPYKHILGCSCKIPADDKSIQCVFTSPPYWKLRNYTGNIDNKCPRCTEQLGRETNHFDFIRNLVEKHFTEVFRVLKDSGSLFINFGETYDKDISLLIGYRLIMKLCDEYGWHLVNEIIWKKTNPKPQGNNRRLPPTYEKIFHLVKKGYEYHYSPVYTKVRGDFSLSRGVADRLLDGTKKEAEYCISKPYKRIGDFLSEQAFNDIVVGSVAQHGDLQKIDSTIDHPAIFPEYLPIIPILSTTEPGDFVLDPFSGSATTGKIALLLGRNYLGMEKINEYYALGEQRLVNTTNFVDKHGMAYVEAIVNNL